LRSSSRAQPAAGPVSWRETHTPHGGILHDTALLAEAGAELFDPQSWRDRGAQTLGGSGRGAVYYLPHGARDWVLRRYRRGGLIGRWIADSFVFLGAARTRSFREARLLGTLCELGLPVPRPVAAHYRRSGWCYHAHLITVRIDAAEPLSAWLARGALPETTWRNIGVMVARFHAAGIWHADLTAHNILVDPSGTTYLLDFDRGRIRGLGRWRQRNLERLHRSLRKIAPDVQEAHFPGPQWQWFCAGYAQLAAI
jgi:3-deoxy-D-manno-octulosonic acid kinase